MINPDDHLPPNAPRFGNAFTRWFGRAVLWGMRYKLEGRFPDEKKLILVAGPHTSNWDLILALATILALGVRINFMMKKEAFFFGVKHFFIALGGIPIDRKNPKIAVKSTYDAFASRDKVWMAVLPEGTRKPSDHWKAGFARIARKVDVPIFIMGLDHPRRTLVFDKIVMPNHNTPEQPQGSAIEQAEELRLYVKEHYSGFNPKNN